MNAAPLALELNRVSKRFGGLRALTDVTLRLEPGRVLGLIGPNGAGKTTLLNVVSGLIKPDDGAIRLYGEDVTRWRPHAVAAQGGIRRTFQNIRMFEGMSVVENILTGLHARMTSGLLSTIARLPRERREEVEARDRADEVIQQLGLAAYADRRADQLPYGIQRRVEIARALVSAPRLLLLDEPTAGMTPRETGDVMELLQGMRARSVTMIVIEHKAGFIMGVSDNVMVLNFGNVIADGPPAAVRSDPKVIEAYLGPEDSDA